MGSIKEVLFHLDKEIYGIDILDVGAIESYTEVRRVPDTTEYIDGLIHLRGEMIPVYNLRKKFKLPPKAASSSDILLIAKAAGMNVAFLVDGVDEIVELDEHESMRAPSLVQGNGTSYIGHVAHLKDRMVLFLDLAELLTKEERESIQKMLENEE